MSARKCASRRSLRRSALSSGARAAAARAGRGRRRRDWTGRCRRWRARSPCRVATISTLGLARTTSVASARIASTSRASLRVISASSRARSPGSSAQVEIPALGLGDDLARHHHDVARAQRHVGALQRGDQQGRQVVAGLDLRDAVERRDSELDPLKSQSSTRGPWPAVSPAQHVKHSLRLPPRCSLRDDTGDADAGAVDLVVAVDADQDRGQRLGRHRVGERAGVDAAQTGRLRRGQPRYRGPWGRRRTPARRSRSARPSAACAPPRCGRPTPCARRGRAASAR